MTNSAEPEAVPAEVPSADLQPLSAASSAERSPAERELVALRLREWNHNVGRSLKPLAAALLTLLFLYNYLVLAQKQFGTVGEATWTAPLRTETAFFVYGVLLAGMLGSLLKHSVLRAKPATGGQAKSDPVGAATYLFVGTIAAFATAILLPTALLVPAEAGSDPFGAVNKWGLTVLAAVVGYASREGLRDFASTLRNLFETVPAIANIEDRVEAGLRRAISPPPFVNFRGAAAIGLHDKKGNWKPTTSAILIERTEYEVAVFIGSTPADIPPSGMLSAPLVVTDGVDQPEVTFDLVVDGSRLGMKLARKSVTLATSDASTLVRFALTAQCVEDAARAAGSSPPNAGAEEAEPPPRTTQVQVSIYQGAIFCGDLRLSVQVAIAEPTSLPPGPATASSES
jgi:hypothetical protein